MVDNSGIKQPKVLIIGGPDVAARIPIIKQMKGDFRFVVAGSQDQSVEPFQEAGIEFWSYTMQRSANPIADLNTLVSLIRLIRFVNADVVHTFDTKPSAWGRLAAKVANVPVVVGTLPGLGSLYAENLFTTRLLRTVYEPIQRLACHQSNLTIFQNSEDANQFVKAGMVPEHRIAILPGSGVETKYYDPSTIKKEFQKQLRTELGIQKADVIVIMISRLIRSKGVLELSETAKIVCKKCPDAKFLLVGPIDPFSVDALSEQEMREIQKSVAWLGPRKDVVNLLSISDVFAFPTYYREGIPRVLLEAASMALPIVATQSAGCTEIVEHNRNGFLVPQRDVEAFSNALLKLIVDPLLRHRFGAESRQRAVSHFDLSIVAEQTTSVYKRLLVQKDYANTMHS